MNSPTRQPLGFYSIEIFRYSTTPMTMRTPESCGGRGQSRRPLLSKNTYGRDHTNSICIYRLFTRNPITTGTEMVPSPLVTYAIYSGQTTDSEPPKGTGISDTIDDPITTRPHGSTCLTKRRHSTLVTTAPWQYAPLTAIITISNWQNGPSNPIPAYLAADHESLANYLCPIRYKQHHRPLSQLSVLSYNVGTPAEDKRVEIYQSIHERRIDVAILMDVGVTTPTTTTPSKIYVKAFYSTSILQQSHRTAMYLEVLSWWYRNDFNIFKWQA